MIVSGIDIVRPSSSCVLIRAAGKVFYVDPFNLPEGSPPADVILITHEHDDHLSIRDIQRVFTPQTEIIITPLSHPGILQFPDDINNLIVVGPQEKYPGEGYSAETILSYNVNKFHPSGVLFHPKEDERIGFILEVAGTRIYIAGDTDIIPEMQGVKNIDIALLPVSGRTVMTAEEAANAVALIKPRYAIPLHYGGREGTLADAERFKKLATCEVVLL